MNISASFEEALERAYHSKAELDRLFTEQRPFLMRLVHHALRFNHWAVFSDEDDLYQEACIWLVDSMWRWDEERGKTLAEYVVYNIGVRLRNYVAKEQAQKRRPMFPPKSLIRKHIDKEIYEQHNIGECNENDIQGDSINPEEALIIKRSIERINQGSNLERLLLEILIENGGNLSGAARTIIVKKKVRLPADMSVDAFRQRLQKKFLPRLRTALVEENIICPGKKL